MPIRDAWTASRSGLLKSSTRRFPSIWLRATLLTAIAAVYVVAGPSIAADSTTAGADATADRHGPVEARFGALTGSVTLAKPEFHVGEPVALRFTLKAAPEKGVGLPKAPNWEMVRVVGIDADQNPIPCTPAGEWLNSLSAPDAMGRRNLFAGRSTSFDVDLAEILQLDQPGEKSVAVTLRFTDMDLPSSANMPKSLTFPALQFEILPTRAPAAPARAKSILLVCYDNYLSRFDGRPRQLSPIEAELVRENERVMREHLAAEAIRLRTHPPSNNPEPAAIPPPGKPVPGTAAAMVIAPEAPNAAAQARRPFSRLAPVAGLATAVAAAIAVVLLRARTRSPRADG